MVRVDGQTRLVLLVLGERRCWAGDADLGARVASGCNGQAGGKGRDEGDAPGGEKAVHTLKQTSVGGAGPWLPQDHGGQAAAPVGTTGWSAEPTPRVLTAVATVCPPKGDDHPMQKSSPILARTEELASVGLGSAPTWYEPTNAALASSIVWRPSSGPLCPALAFDKPWTLRWFVLKHRFDSFINCGCGVWTIWFLSRMAGATKTDRRQGVVAARS